MLSVLNTQVRTLNYCKSLLKWRVKDKHTLEVDTVITKAVGFIFDWLLCQLGVLEPKLDAYNYKCDPA